MSVPAQNNLSAPQQAPEAAPIPKKKINKRFIIVLSLLIIGGGAFGITKYLHGQKHEETDDAQVEANISPVIPRVSGYVAKVMVRDNELVKEGDTLMILDDKDALIKVEQAEAALAAARSGVNVAEASTTASRANIATTQANVATANAQIEAARVNVWRTKQDYDRYANLVKDHSITQQQFEQAQAAKQTAERQLDILTEQRNAAQRQSGAASQQTNATASQVSVASATIRMREADLDNAKLNHSYTILTAPAAGKLSRVNVQSGQFVQAGQSLFQIVVNEAPWVVANFKETQIGKMQPGQKVSISVDAFPDRELEGEVASFSPATGSKFSLLPADNSSGNFIKVVGRVAVKIVFKDTSGGDLARLRPGMNADVDVHIK